jgi:hypothetical protein
VRRALALACLLALGCLALPAGAAAEGGTTFPLISYWRDGRQDRWFNFGSRFTAADGHVLAPPVWILASGVNANGEPRPVGGQGMIFDVVPGEPGYSDLWQAVWVQAPPGYKPNTITSRQQIEQLGLKQTHSDDYLDCPFVQPEDRIAGSDAPPRQGWVKGQPVYYFELGEVPDTLGKMWRFANGVNDQGQPRLVPGQMTVSDPSPAAFREVFLVQVPADYQANTITSVAQIQQAGYPIRPLNIRVNVPLPPRGAPAPSPASARLAVVGVLALAWLAGAAYLLRQRRPDPVLARLRRLAEQPDPAVAG